MDSVGIVRSLSVVGMGSYIYIIYVDKDSTYCYLSAYSSSVSVLEPVNSEHGKHV